MFPQTYCYRFYDPPEVEGRTVEFRLIYKGQLPAENRGTSHPKVKHSLRKIFHLQLREALRQDPLRRWQFEELVTYRQSSAAELATSPTSPRYQARPTKGKHGKVLIDHIADQFCRCGYRFVPSF